MNATWLHRHRLLSALSSILITGTASFHKKNKDSEMLLSPVPKDNDGPSERGGETNNNNECGIYFARSTIPGAGSGLYAGRHFAPGELVARGDVTVPVIDDVDFHNNEPIYNLPGLLHAYVHQ